MTILTADLGKYSISDRDGHLLVIVSLDTHVQNICSFKPVDNLASRC